MGTEERQRNPEINRLFWLLLVLVLLNIWTASQTFMVRVDLGSRTTARQEMSGQLQRFADANRKVNEERWKLLEKHFDDLEKKLDAHLKNLR